MSQRNTTIAVSNDEKERLDAIANQRYGSTHVPYGIVITELADVYEQEVLAIERGEE